MSRIGKKPITLPAGVVAEINGGEIKIKGAKGTLTRVVDSVIGLKLDGSTLTLVCQNESKDAHAKHGLYRALLNNMVVGVSSGFTKTIVINGIGYKAAVNGNKLVLNIGYSHPVEVIAPEGIKFELAAPTEINVSGCDKELVGQVAANIKAKRPVEPYHAYGIRYKTEAVIIKEGKKSGK